VIRIFLEATGRSWWTSLLAQPFAFLNVGFGASVAVFIDLALLATLRYLQSQEKRLSGGLTPTDQAATAEAGVGAPGA
jgi:hypothetical protein